MAVSRLGLTLIHHALRVRFHQSSNKLFRSVLAWYWTLVNADKLTVNEIKLAVRTAEAIQSRKQNNCSSFVAKARLLAADGRSNVCVDLICFTIITRAIHRVYKYKRAQDVTSMPEYHEVLLTPKWVSYREKLLQTQDMFCQCDKLAFGLVCFVGGSTEGSPFPWGRIAN